MANPEQLARILRSVEEWNKWYLENLEIQIDLSKANLSGANLSGAKLSQADLIEVDLSEANLSGAFLSQANLSGADLFAVNLSEAILNQVNLSGADLSEANLSGAFLFKADLSGAFLNGAFLGYITLEEAILSGAFLELTNLERANLTEANMNGASLRRANLVEANLKGAELIEANLSGANLARTNLKRANLGKANLRKASLEEAHLNGADLSEADLHGACLTKACFIRAEALATNFEFATLTGAYLKDWNTNGLTNLQDLQADYIYLNVGEEGKFTERRPHSGNFKPGEFAALVQKTLDTIDLIFIDGIDWQAFFASFQELRQQYTDADLKIQAIEKKNGGSFVVRLEASGHVDVAAIEQTAQAKYETQLQILEARYKAKLEAKDEIIQTNDKRHSTDMDKVLEALAKASKTQFFQYNYGGINSQNDISGGEVNQADTINVDRTSITNNIKGANIGNFANQMSDHASQTYNAAPDKSLAEAAQEIQTLLDQLSQTYPSETMLQKAQFADAAATQAKANPTLRQRLLSAVDAGTIGAVEELLSHPVATFFIAAVKDWEATNPDS